MKKITSILLLMFLFNCDKKEISSKENIRIDSTYIKQQPVADISNLSKLDFIDRELEEKLKMAILYGDTLAYRTCYKQYVINGYDKEFLYYAVIMAEKNNYKRAYDDVSRILDLKIDDSSKKMDEFSSTFGTYSLLKAYEMGDTGAKQVVKNIYLEKKISIPMSSSIYCSK